MRRDELVRILLSNGMILAGAQIPEQYRKQGEGQVQFEIRRVIHTPFGHDFEWLKGYTYTTLNWDHIVATHTWPASIACDQVAAAARARPRLTCSTRYASRRTPVRRSQRDGQVARLFSGKRAGIQDVVQPVVVRELAERLAATPVLVVKEARSVDREIVHQGGLGRGAEQRAPAGARVRLATHDPVLREPLLAAGGIAGVEMLLGVRGSDAVALRDRGVQVGLYVPYGERWFRYLMRRRAEAQGA